MSICCTGNFFFAGARLFFRSLEAAIFLFSRVARIPEGSLVLPAICTEERITLGAEMANGTVIRGQNEISHPAAPGQLKLLGVMCRHVPLLHWSSCCCRLLRSQRELVQWPLTGYATRVCGSSIIIGSHERGVCHLTFWAGVKNAQCNRLHSILQQGTTQSCKGCCLDLRADLGKLVQSLQAPSEWTSMDGDPL